MGHPAQPAPPSKATARVPKPTSRLRRLFRLVAWLVLLSLIVAVNFVAYMQAYSMTHFADAGSTTPRPETLSLRQKAAVIMTGVRVAKPTGTATPTLISLPFTVHRIPSTGGAELEAWHIPHPNAKGLVLVFHGYAACKAFMLVEAEAFHKLGYAALLVDFRGSGGSNLQHTTVGITEADDVVAAYHYAEATWPGASPVLFGSSMGSVAILRAVGVLGIEPRALVLECPFDRMLSTTKHRFDRMGLPSFPFAHLLVFWGGVQHGFNAFSHNPVEYARGVHCPVLQLHGADDPLVLTEEARAIFANLPTEQKRFELLAGVTHQPYARATPRVWTMHVSKFMSELGVPAGVR